jgi:hypothetical protein
MAKTLSSLLSRSFKAPAERKPDVHRKAREDASALASQHNIEIERIESGFNVWPPKGFAGTDPYDGDHYAGDWSEVLLRVRAYISA